MLVGVRYIDKLLMCLFDAVAGSLHGALAGSLHSALLRKSTVNTCSASALGCFGRFALIFYAKGNSDPKVVSCPALRCLGCEKRAQSMLQLPSEPVVARANWTLRPRAIYTLHLVVRCSGVA